MIERSYNRCPMVCRNVRKARQLWIRLGKILQIAVEDTLVSAMFYQEMVKVVLLFREETWVLSAAMSNSLDGLHVGLLIKVTGMMAKRQRDRTWRIAATSRVIK